MKILIFFFYLFTFKAQAFILPDDYKSGEVVCAEHAKEREGEFFKWVQVPVDYNHPENGNTALYAYTKKPFNRALPTLIFFTGGPGVSSRSTEFSLAHFNVLFFEQRGISCSRPANRELFLSPEFYSSENTARDAFEIIKAWNLNSVSVYGHSYGTIAATIFASFFPNQTRSLILEGVVYHADQSLWLTQTRNQLLQKLYDSLSLEDKNRIKEISESGSVPMSWFSKIGNMMLYLNNGVESYREFLKNIFSNPDMDIISFINNFYTNPNNLEENFSFGDVTMGMIGCREMSMSNPDLSLTTIFKDGKLVNDRDNRDRISQCRPIGLEDAYKTSMPYKADNYPVIVPVQYLLGSTDGATPIEQGMGHYQNVAQGKKQLLIMPNGGHLPSLGLLKEKRECTSDDTSCDGQKQNKIQEKIFETLALAKQIDKSLIEEFNSAGELNWNVH